MNATLLRLGCVLWLVVAVLAAAFAQESPRPAAGAVDRARLEQRLAAVAVLLEKSSAARQIEASGEARVLEKRDKARAVYRQARAAFEAGDLQRASQLLPEASVLMFEAVRLASPEQVTGPKLKADLDARMESVRALAAAQKRIGAEKPGTPGAAEAAETIEKLLGEAEQLVRANDIARARAALDQAYLVARAAISSMRGGDTLVRSLTFATKQEEYHYEIDRNDTHQMLIRVLLEGKPRGPAQQSFIDKARELRAQAEAAAAGGDHAGAVRLLEESTRELVRAIRSAGVYIPG